MKAYEKVFVSSLVVLAAVLYTESNKSKNLFPENIRNKSAAVKSEFANDSGIDSVTVKRLLPMFKVKKDQYDPNSYLCYREKNTLKFCHDSGLYCYFEQINNVTANLRFCFQIQATEWMFIKRCQFLIDGNAFEYYPLNSDYYPGDGAKVCEWFDDPVNENNFNILKAISVAKEVNIKLTGRHYHTVIEIPKKQRESIFNTLALYKALNGKIEN